MNTRLPVIVLFISSVGWGLTWLPIKALSDMGLNGLHLVFIAFISGSFLLLPWLYRQYSSWKKNMGLMLMIAIAGGIANVCFQVAIYHGDIVRVMILFYMLPVWSVLGGLIFLNEKIDSIRATAVALCLSGAFVILDVWHTSWQGVTWIDALALGAGLGLAATNILFRFAQEIPVMSKVSATFIGCTVMIGVSLVMFSNAEILPGSGAILWAVAYGALWLTLITIGTQWAVTQMEAGRSATIIVMELVVAVVSSTLIVGSGLALHEIIGCMMVLIAALLEGFRNEDAADLVSDSTID
ncbi:hypothetical protein MNBD_GAMMA06-621 [hydrothermal vent metagenome]|uniref:EamA domain-containing protein n=1 Tax=hydrothermal vent metagenome TaxID=652676 RepID=A0A3B0WVV6_9ZZZZ